MQNFEHFLVTHAEKIVQTQKILSLVVEDVLGPQLLARQFLGSFESGTLNCLKKSFIGQKNQFKKFFALIHRSFGIQASQMLGT